MINDIQFQTALATVVVRLHPAAQLVHLAGDFLQVMGLPVRETPLSYFNGDLVEIMKENGRGTHGHIGFSVNDVEAAIRYFEERGLKSIPETKKFDENGKCFFPYFEGEIGGFAIHIVQQ